MNEMNIEKRNPSDYSIQELRGLCQNTAPNPAKESKLGRFSRIFSIYVTYIFLRLPFTPNQISVIGVLVFFLGVCAYLSTNPYVQLLGPASYFLSILLDGVDGEVARFRHAQSKVGGQYVEPISHDMMYGIYFMLLGMILYPIFDTVWVIYAGAVASVTKLLARSMQYRFWMLVHVEDTPKNVAEQNAMLDARPWYRRQFDFWNKNIYSYPAIVGPLLIATLVGRTDLFLYFYAASFAVMYVLLFAQQVRYLATHTIPN